MIKFFTKIFILALLPILVASACTKNIQDTSTSDDIKVVSKENASPSDMQEENISNSQFVAVSKNADAKDEFLVSKVVKTSFTYTIIYVNESSVNLNFDDFYTLQILNDDTWLDVPTREDIGAYNDILHILRPNNSFSKDLFLRFNYGELDSGHYRLVKEMSLGEYDFDACDEDKFHLNEDNKIVIFTEFDIN